MQQGEAERLEPRLAGNLRPGPAFRLVGEIEIFEPGLGVGSADRSGEHRRQLALLVDAGENGGTALVELAQVRQAFFERAQLRVVEAGGGLLAITRDERHGGLVVEQRNRRFHLRHADVQLLGNTFGYGFHVVGSGMTGSYCINGPAAGRSGVQVRAHVFAAADLGHDVARAAGRIAVCGHTSTPGVKSRRQETGRIGWTTGHMRE